MDVVNFAKITRLELLVASWRQIFKRVAYWTLPLGIQDIVRARLRQNSVAERSVAAEDRATLERNRELCNRHAGERCFILAAGPSIKRQDLKLLQGETCIAVSNFFVHPDFAVIRPRYYCLAPYHPPITEEAWRSWLAETEAGSGDAVMFFGLEDQQRNRWNGLFAGRQVHYLRCGGDSWEPLLIHGVDLTRSVPGPQSVTIMALLAALYMGFGEVYLLGCDHDWILHLNASSHFYDEDQHTLNRHGYNEWLGADLEYYCQCYIRLWQQYKALRQIADGQSVRIYNATDGGLLDVFPRVKFESLFDRKVL